MLASTPSGWDGDLLESDGTLEGDLDARLLDATIHVETFLNCNEKMKEKKQGLNYLLLVSATLLKTGYISAG